MAKVVLVRVDDRYIHGQILEAWIPYTKANAILVINDELSKDEYRKRVMEFSVPQEVEVLIKDLDRGIEYLKGIGGTEEVSQGLVKKILRLSREKRVMVIFGDLRDAVSVYHRGFRFKELNLGNIHRQGYVKALSPSLFLDQEDLDLLNELEAEGVVIDLRSIPGREGSKDLKGIVGKH